MLAVHEILLQSYFQQLLIASLSFLFWDRYAVVTRSVTQQIRVNDYITAAQALGASHTRIIWGEILPNVMNQIIVIASLEMAVAIIIEAALSFLGLGIQPPLPSWGNLLTNAQEMIWESPLQAFYPGVLIFATVIAFNFLGDGLQDALDPRATEDRAN